MPEIAEGRFEVSDPDRKLSAIEREVEKILLRSELLNIGDDAGNDLVRTILRPLRPLAGLSARAVLRRGGTSGDGRRSVGRGPGLGLGLGRLLKIGRLRQRRTPGQVGPAGRIDGGSIRLLGQGIRPGLTSRVGLAVGADSSIRQVATSFHLRPDLADVLMGAAHLITDPALAPVGPSGKSQLYRMGLVGTRKTVTVGAIGTESEPERVLNSPVVDMRGNLGASRATMRRDAMEAVGEMGAGAVAKDDDGRKLDTFLETLRVIVDNVGIDDSAHLGTGVESDGVNAKHLGGGRGGHGRRRGNTY